MSNAKNYRIRCIATALGLMVLQSLFYLTDAVASCPSNITPSAPNSRYTLLNNDTEALDKQTQLIWQRCSLGQQFNGDTCKGVALSLSQQEATNRVANLGSGYRLPSLKELRSLREVACSNPSINSDIFPNTVSNLYWANTLNDGYSFYAWFVYYDVNGENSEKTPTVGFVRAVREHQTTTTSSSKIFEGNNKNESEALPTTQLTPGLENRFTIINKTENEDVKP